MSVCLYSLSPFLSGVQSLDDGSSGDIWCKHYSKVPECCPSYGIWLHWRDGGISMKSEALEDDLFEQGVQMRK